MLAGSSIPRTSIGNTLWLLVLSFGLVIGLHATWRCLMQMQSWGSCQCTCSLSSAIARAASKHHVTYPLTCHL